MIHNLQIPHWDTPQCSTNNAIDTATPISLAHHLFSTDNFRMFHYKVRSCPRVRSHDWTDCPYAHPAEKARRRDPCNYHYSGVPCPDFRKGHCHKADSCEFAHGVFECWLHPSRYRTQLCKDGTFCRRRVCFFAHAPDQLRVLESNYNDSPVRRNNASPVSSPTSVLNRSSHMSDSPPSSPGVTLVSSMRGVQIDEVESGSAQMRFKFGWPRGANVRPGYSRVAYNEEEAGMERVESGRDIRARMYAKLCKENFD